MERNMITRREFLRQSALTAAALGGVYGGDGYSAARHASIRTDTSHDFFSFAPFLEENPNAVFVKRTAVNGMRDYDGFEREGNILARQIFQPAPHGWTTRTKIAIKPNIVRARPPKGEDPELTQGIVTNPYFVGGFIDGMRKAGPSDYTVLERGATDEMFKARRYTEVSQKKKFRLLNYGYRRYTDYKDSELNWHEVPDGRIWRRLPTLRPVLDPETMYISIPTLKAHNLGVITLSVKNQQGVIPTGYGHFCQNLRGLTRKTAAQLEHFRPLYDIGRFVTSEMKRHIEEGYFRWDCEGVQEELWAQRTLETFNIVRPALSVIEGIVARDGDYDSTGRDFLHNIVIFGRSPLYVDMIGHYLAGHGPWNVGLFRIARERGMIPTVLPQNIDVYEITDKGPAFIEDIESWEKKFPVAVGHHSIKITHASKRYPVGYTTPDEFIFLDDPVTNQILKGERFSRSMNFQMFHDTVPGSPITFSYEIEKAGAVQLTIFDTVGHPVNVLVKHHQASGLHTVHWDMIDACGLPVPQGHYAAQLRANGRSIIQKVFVV
jgi:uncharacterized protein (DUF362 family)